MSNEDLKKAFLSNVLSTKKLEAREKNPNLPVGTHIVKLIKTEAFESHDKTCYVRGEFLTVASSDHPPGKIHGYFAEAPNPHDRKNETRHSYTLKDMIKIGAAACGGDTQDPEVLAGAYENREELLGLWFDDKLKSDVFIEIKVVTRKFKNGNEGTVLQAVTVAPEQKYWPAI